MQQMQGTFKLVNGESTGYDLLFEKLSGFGDAEGKRAVGTLEGAFDVVKKVLGRPLTAGEQQTLAIGNGLVVSFNAENYETYF